MSEADRAARFEQIEILKKELSNVVSDRDSKNKQIEVISEKLAQADHDREARYGQIKKLEAKLNDLQGHLASELNSLGLTTGEIKNISGQEFDILQSIDIIKEKVTLSIALGSSMKSELKEANNKLRSIPTWIQILSGKINYFLEKIKGK